MPEGDTIWLAAQKLRPVLEGRPIVQVISRWIERERGLVGRTVRSLETVGKHLLIHLDDDTTVRVHLGMNGAWKVLPPDTSLERRRGSVSLGLRTPEAWAVAFTAPTVERFRDRERAVHPVLSRLGPDLLGEEPDWDQVVARARATDPARTVAELLLDQQVACGLGNVYKCELLFLHRLHPDRPVGELDDATLRSLYVRGRELLRANLVPRPRNTTGRPDHRTWVYGREGRPCLRCRTRLVGAWHGRDLPRRTTFCPRCQR